jgi:hypothetical protein
MKRIKSFFRSGFISCVGHSIATHLYYYEGKPQIGFIIRNHYVIFWLSGFNTIGIYPTQKEALEDAERLGITL